MTAPAGNGPIHITSTVIEVVNIVVAHQRLGGIVCLDELFLTTEEHDVVDRARIYLHRNQLQDKTEQVPENSIPRKEVLATDAVGRVVES
jgi:hypothetical protein